MNADIANCNQIMLLVIVINIHYRIIYKDLERYNDISLQP